MMTDVTVIAQRLGPIAEAGKNIATLQTFVKDKSMPRKNVGQAMAGLLKRSGSKKEVNQEEPAADSAAEKDDGDEDQDGESLGILTSDQATDRETQNRADEAARDEESSEPGVASAVQAVKTTEESIPTTADEAPTTQPKDLVTETKKLEPAEEDDTTVTETLAAPLEEKELPVEPVSPMDAEDAPSTADDKDAAEEPPMLPLKDNKTSSDLDPVAPDRSTDKGVMETSPDVPAKTD